VPRNPITGIAACRRARDQRARQCRAGQANSDNEFAFT
jgi:hypothetical protein